MRQPRHGKNFLLVFAGTVILVVFFGRGTRPFSLQSPREERGNGDRLENEGRDPPLFSFGLVADIHAADRLDRVDEANRRPRYFRGAVAKASEAFDDWRDDDVSFVLQLGDVLDGSNALQGTAEWALAKIDALVQRISVFSVVGNHEMLNFSKKRWGDVLSPGATAEVAGIEGDAVGAEVTGRTFFSFSYGGFRFVGLDVFDSGRSAGISGPTGAASPLAAAAAAAAGDGLAVAEALGDAAAAATAVAAARLETGFMAALPAVDDDEDALAAAAAAAPLTPGALEAALQEVAEAAAASPSPCLGSISMAQLGWLEGEIEEAAENGQRVIVFSHLPLLPRSSTNCVLRNSAEVLDVLRGSFLHDSLAPAGRGYGYGGVVAAVFSGAHRHDGWYQRDDSGLHHLALEGLVGSPPDAPPSVATARVYADRIELSGAGAAAAPRVLLLPPRPGAAGTVGAREDRGASHGMEVLG